MSRNNERTKKVNTDNQSYYQFKDLIPILKQKRVQRQSEKTKIHKIGAFRAPKHLNLNQLKYI